MASLTKKQTKQLCGILDLMERANDWLHSDEIAICLVRREPTTTHCYTRQVDGRVVYEITKEVGCKLCYLPDGLQQLADFVAENGFSPKRSES